MSIYEECIQCLCRTGQYTPERARELALSREVEKYYRKEDFEKSGKCSTYTSVGECI